MNKRILEGEIGHGEECTVHCKPILSCQYIFNKYEIRKKKYRY
jgi:hypothetical protein